VALLRRFGFLAWSAAVLLCRFGFSFGVKCGGASPRFGVPPSAPLCPPPRRGMGFFELSLSRRVPRGATLTHSPDSLVRVFEWTHGKCRPLRDLQDRTHLLAQAERLAVEVGQVLAREPGRPIYLAWTRRGGSCIPGWCRCRGGSAGCWRGTADSTTARPRRPSWPCNSDPGCAAEEFLGPFRGWRGAPRHAKLGEGPRG
jgi:hypothetical protein